MRRRSYRLCITSRTPVIPAKARSAASRDLAAHVRRERPIPCLRRPAARIMPEACLRHDAHGMMGAAGWRAASGMAHGVVEGAHPASWRANVTCHGDLV
jgi:hypothetical protein